MKRHILLILSTFAITFLFSKCDDNYFADSRSSIIVEGWIEDGEFPVVFLTKSLPVSKKETPIDDLSAYLIKWAVVTISDGIDTVVLTGKYDKNYFPPYVYTTGRMRGKSGRTYSLKVSYEDYLAETETTIPSKPLFDSLYSTPIQGSDSARSVTASFRHTAPAGRYYQLFVRDNKYTQQYLTSYLGCLGPDIIEENNEVPVHSPSRYDTEDYITDFRLGDTIFVKLAHLDSLSHSFWNIYEKKKELGSNMMFPYDNNLPSNIRGGLGYWFGYGTEVRRLIIK